MAALMISSIARAQVSPEESIKTFTLADGLECTLFAAEPMLVNPCDIDVDARGRVWVCEGANYRQWAKPPLRPQRPTSQAPRWRPASESTSVNNGCAFFVSSQGTQAPCPRSIAPGDRARILTRISKRFLPE